MKKYFQYKIGDLNLVFGVTEENKIRMLHYSVLPFDTEKDIDPALLETQNLVEVQISGYNQPNHKGNKLSNTLIGEQLVFQRIEQNNNCINVEQIFEDEKLNLKVITTFETFPDSNGVSCSSEIVNMGVNDFGIEYISSINLADLNSGSIFQEYQNQILYVPHNSWTGELQWESGTLKEMGLDFQLDGEKLQDSTKAISITNNSSWSCAQFSPNAILVNQKLGISTFWQIDTNGEWHWELTDCGLGKYLSLRGFGPTEPSNHWWKQLKPGESFTTVPVFCGNVFGTFDEAVGKLTNYRRSIRRENIDNEKCPVIFNDYMNCLMGDPTSEKEFPLIDKAAEVGCEYYVIDCGWYSDGYWWDNVGEWKESVERFPNGIIELTNYIREKGMIPGLWLEIEVMGINSQLANSLPDDWFFCRHGARVKDHSRYHLDFRNEEVQRYATSVIDRLLTDYGIGYIKMDYNTTTGIGSDLEADSFSDALLMHNRSYLKWLDGVFSKYPDLVIENCGSGGMRHDYQMLRRHSIQSVTDQTDYLRNGAIAAICASAITPEQGAIWSYPLKNANEEEVIFNMVNSMLLRIHQSGHLAELDATAIDLVRDGIDIYKEIRQYIPESQPFWPTGIPHIDDGWFSFGLRTNTGSYLAVWRTNGREDQFSIPFDQSIEKIEKIFPLQDNKTNFSYSKNHMLVEFPEFKMARLFKIQ
ncbi:glycoside hydrolase family 36 protein [Enterococcus sp.]|uniref:glycoside hydrolase family 36 protein n=1 Tax=Enterococcus sp. TaxID=35783 RepID=UPI003C78A0E6